MTNHSNDNGAEKKGRPCPICGKPSMPDYRPFCSSRCANVDLGRWLGGSYAIASEEAEAEADAEEPSRRTVQDET